MATATGGKTMELEGALGAFQLPDVLRFLAMGRLTGHLTLVNDLRSVTLCIKEGRLVGSASPDRHLKLGQVLVYGGQVSRKDLEETLDAQQETFPERMLGELLIERRLAAPEQIAHALQLQLEEELWDLLNWTEGTFKFEHGAGPAMERAMVTLEIEPLLEEGARRKEQWLSIARTLGRPDDVYRVRPDVAAMPEFKLNPNTWRVLSLINGRHSVEVLVYLSGLGKFETLCALDKLLALQWIERVEEPEAAAPEPPPRSAPPPETTHDDERTTDGDGRSSATRRGLFGFRRRAAGEPDLTLVSRFTPPGNGTGPFPTTVALACDLINRLAGRLCEEPAFGSEPAPLLAALWRSVGLRFPRADLIAIRDGWLTSDAFDRYVAMAGGPKPFLVGCFEDGLAALAAVGRQLAQRARERLGARAEGLIQGTVQPYVSDAIRIVHAAETSVRAWTHQWVRHD